jgi:hypothetical protein
MNNYPRGVVNTKKHPELKQGQVVMIIEVTKDLYVVKITEKSKPVIVSISDITIM